MADRALVALCALFALSVPTISCGVRTPARIDVAALVRARGADQARHDLELRVVEHPADLGARLALAAIAEQQHRPSQAIEQLEAVVAYGGPAGTRWHPDDRARLARLVAARGRARLERGAPSAYADLSRARELGATIEDRELARARLTAAIAQLRHVDADERAAGKRTLVALATTELADPAWRGAAPNATPAQHGAFGVWLWSVGARRAAWDELAAWHAGAHALRDDAIASTYLAARTWWTPIDGAPPPAPDLVGAQRCRYTDAPGCSVVELAHQEPRDDAAIAARLARPSPRTTQPAEAAGWLALTLLQALHGDASWAAAFAARVDTSAIAVTAMPAPYRAAYARLTGRGTASDAGTNLGELTPTERLVVAAGRALDGESVAEVRTALGPAADTPEGRAILAVVVVPPTPKRAEPPPPPAGDSADGTAPAPTATASIRTARMRQLAAAIDHVRTRVVYGLDAARLQRVGEAYVRDPAVGDRIARDVVAESIDAATAHASLGALYDALGDPARARAAWQAAVDASPEPEHVRGLAEAMARANDPDAALVIGTTAAAAWGDPAVVWASLANALERSGKHVHALEAARNAIDLAGPDVLGRALDIAIEASRALGRDAQVASLQKRGAAASGARDEAPDPVPTASADADPTDVRGALASHQRAPSAASLARLYAASRWNPRDVALRAALLDALPADDARRHVIEAELRALAVDPDPEVGRTAVEALAPPP
ncbi:MAG TPA: hypothetical protein VFQ53_39955 [Kofleriaceae bacterium]|nr:hypothetical protein [Kofleriaceae bacterium]